jgi:AcrR family transcriptional regulator
MHAAKKKPVTRGKGRPSEETAVGRSALIAAAEELLRQAPPDRITLADIARHAHVTPRLIRYYFGTKEALFMETVALQLDELQQRGQSAVVRRVPLEDRMDERLRTMIEQVQANPRFHQIIMDAVYTGSTRESRHLTEQALSRGMQITQALMKGAGDEALRDVDLRYLHVALIGMTEFFGSADPFLQQLFGPDATPEKMRNDYVAFVTDVVLNGLRKRPESTERD